MVQLRWTMAALGIRRNSLVAWLARAIYHFYPPLSVAMVPPDRLL